jgi:enoyl-CoA hydratase
MTDELRYDPTFPPGGNFILSEIRGHVGVLTLNRPERHNAFNDEMGDAYARTMESLIADDSVRCIVLLANGKSFSTGRDTGVLGHRAQGESDFAFVRRWQEMRLAHAEAAKPIVAAVRGYVMGGGFETALSADMRIAASDAVFSMPEINYGLLPDTGGSQFLTLLIGAARAKYLVLSGRHIDASTALAWGLVEFVVPPEELDAEAISLATELASKPPMALAMGKQMVDQYARAAVRGGMQQELLAQTALFKTEDYAEAKAARRENRTPNYTGR